MKVALLFALLGVVVTSQSSFFSPSHLQFTRDFDDKLELEGCEEASGICSCQVYDNYTLKAQYEDLQDLTKYLQSLQEDLQALDIGKIRESMEELLSRIAKLEELILSQSVATTVHELMGMQKNVDIMSGLLDDLHSNGANNDTLAGLEEELYQLHNLVQDLWQRHPASNAEELQQEIEELKARLIGCPQWYNVSYFRGDSLPLTIQDDEGWCDRFEVSGFGEAVVHKWEPSMESYSKVWFKDPAPGTMESRSEIYTRRQVSYYSRYEGYKFQTYPTFLSSSQESEIFDLEIAGSGMIAYNGSIYYHSYGDSRLNRLHLSSGSRQYIAFPEAGINEYRQNPDETYVDFKVDEYGVYALTAPSSNYNKMSIYKIDESELGTLAQWPSSRQKLSICTAFMICGKMYTLDECTHRLAPSRHHTQYVFDTISGKESYLEYSITAKFGKLHHLTYNHREKVLFGFDNGHSVTYPIKWVRKQ